MYCHGGLEFEKFGNGFIVRVQDGTTENAPVTRTVVFDAAQLSEILTEVSPGANPFLTKKPKKVKEDPPPAPVDPQPAAEVEKTDADLDNIVAKMLNGK